MSDMRVALTLSLNDRLVAPLRRALDEVEKHLVAVERDLKDVGNAGQQAGQQLSGMQGPAQAAKQVTELARNTQNAVSLADKLRDAWSRAGNMVKGVSTAVAGVQAAKFVLAEPLQKQRSYERMLTDASNTAFADRKDVAGRKAGVQELDVAVTTSLRAGGGKREDALSALNDMIASGTMSVKEATSLLPTVMKYATAGNAAPNEIGAIAVKALQNGFTQEQIPIMLDKALAAGQAGGFELKDMAKWLPTLLAMGKNAGLSGMKGYERILASAQAATITAGTKDEAGTNLRDLLQHVSSHALTTAAKKMGIDAAGTIAASLGKGDDTLTALVKLSDFVANKDPRYADLQKKLNALPVKVDAQGKPLPDDERTSIMRQQANLLQGSAIGQLFHNQQSVLALVAERNNRAYIQDVLAKTGAANGQVGQLNFDTIASTNDFKVQQADNEKLFAQTNVLSSVNDGFAKLAVNTVDLYQAFPKLGAAIEGVVLAAKTIAMVVGAMSGIGALLMLAKGGAAAGATGAATGILGGAAAGGAVATGAVTAGAAALAGGVGYGAGRLVHWGIEGTKADNMIGRGVASVASFFGSDDATRALEQEDKFDRSGAGSGRVNPSDRFAVNKRPAFDTFFEQPSLVGNPLVPPPGGGMATPAAGSPRDAQAVDLKALIAEAKAPQQVNIKIDAPDFLSVQQISNQVARDARRGM